jgi:hypothetical protein
MTGFYYYVCKKDIDNNIVYCNKSTTKFLEFPQTHQAHQSHQSPSLYCKLQKDLAYQQMGGMSFESYFLHTELKASVVFILNHD